MLAGIDTRNEKSKTFNIQINRRTAASGAGAGELVHNVGFEMYAVHVIDSIAYVDGESIKDVING